MSTVYLLTLEALDAADNPVTLRFASGDYHADGNNWPPRLSRPMLFAGRARLPWLRDVSTSQGDLELANADGRLDYLIDYAIDGRAMTIQTWDGATLRTVLRGTVARVEAARASIRLILRDPAEYLSNDHPHAVYAGDGTDLEGDADIAGQPKPQVLGAVSNATPVLVDYGMQIYQVSSLVDCTITAARDRGVPLTAGAPYADQAELLDQALTPAAGTFRAWQGFVRLGETAQSLTVDAEQASAHGADVLEQLVTAAGGTVATPPVQQEPYITADGSAYETADGSDYQVTSAPLSALVGIYLSDTRSTASMLDELAASIGGFWRTNADGDVAMSLLLIGTPADVIPEHRVLDIERQRGGAGDNGLPVYRVTVRADRVATVQNDLAAGATRRARWQSEYRAFRATDDEVRTRHPLSRELTVDTALRAGGQILADRLGALLAPRRDSTQVTARLDQYGDREIGETVTVEHPRFGYAGGRDMIVLGRTPDAEAGAVTLEVWG